METAYKNDLKQTYLILGESGSAKEDYQVAMLRENRIPGILRTDIQYIDDKTRYFYDISGKIPFQMAHEKVKVSGNEIKKLTEKLLGAICELKKYMLDANCILLEPDLIFCENDEFYFCYYPPGDGDAGEKFHKLTEYLVREVDYQDNEGVQLAYMLHKATMEANYSLEEIMKRWEISGAGATDGRMEAEPEARAEPEPWGDGSYKTAFPEDKAEAGENEAKKKSLPRRILKWIKERYWYEDDEDEDEDDD